jgi:predicted N-acetyltransferase YhbS
MNNMNLSQNSIITHFKSGQESSIVNFLNQCFGNWGTQEKWRKLYKEYPTFTEDNVFIIESNNKIIAHRGLHFRDFVVRENHKLLTVTLGDTAVHPEYRGSGIYSKLHKATLESARLKGACLAFTWNLKGSTTYKNNLKTGFVEIRQIPSYIKIINREKCIKSGLSDYFHKNQGIKTALGSLKDNLLFSVGDMKFPIGELFGDISPYIKNKKDIITIIVTPGAASDLANFRTINSYSRIMKLISLYLQRKIMIKFSSFCAFNKFIQKGIFILGSM